jgi:hypothetical protein
MEGTCRLGSLAVPALVEIVQEREKEREFWSSGMATLLLSSALDV